MTRRSQLVLAWLGLTVCFAAVALHWQWSGAVAAHERDGTTLHRIVSQRVDQHDAHLTGLSALTTSSTQPPIDALQAVAATIIQFYPRILAVDIVAIDQPAEAGAIYTSRKVPATVPTDDVLAAARRGSRRAEVVAAPGTTGRYLLVKRAPNSDAARYALSLEIDGQRLIETDSATVSANAMRALPDGQPIYASSSLIHGASNSIFHLKAETQLASSSQPMRLSLHRNVPVTSLIPWGWIAASAAATGTLLLLVRNMLMARLAERNAIARATASAQEARLAHATRINAMGELSLGIAHELTQPLAALLSQSQAGLRMMRSSVHDYEAIGGVLEANARHAKRAGDLLQKLRDWNSADPPTNQVVDLNQVITEIALFNRTDLARRSIELRLGLQQQAPTAAADQVGLEQVVQNLLVNARDACQDARPKGSLIRINTFSKGDQVGFTVSDDGPGFGADVAERLFEPFFTSKPDGMGLGLSICRRLVETFRGEILAANHGDGGSGAVITVTLPAAPEDRAKPSRKPE
jgi:two-component system, LuxR family, sensor kinase FixL